MPPKRPLAERFWEKVEKGPSCWLWTASTYSSGYGEIGIGGYSGNTSAHRVSWQLHHGEIPPGMQVLHRCDVKLCVNPDHLFLGSAADNTHDMMAKGRDKFGWRKLAPEHVLNIRKHCDLGVLTVSELASLYGVCNQTIYHVRNRRTWADI